MFLCGLDFDGNPTAINIANAQAVSFDGEWIMVEWSDTKASRSVEAKDAVVCTPQRVAAVLMSLKERNP
jgi:hypothetical protein